jgi:hypothetical protein
MQAEWQVDVEVDFFDATVAQPQRERVPGVDGRRCPDAQVDP